MINPLKKIEFAPGVLEQIEQEMSQEELQEFLNMLKTSFESGTIFDESEVVDLEELAISDPDVYNHIIAALKLAEEEQSIPTRVLH